jgi:hypothetical protein
LLDNSATAEAFGKGRQIGKATHLGMEKHHSSQ